jgi:hypothetical protein
VARFKALGRSGDSDFCGVGVDYFAIDDLTSWYVGKEFASHQGVIVVVHKILRHVNVVRIVADHSIFDGAAFNVMICLGFRPVLGRRNAFHSEVAHDDRICCFVRCGSESLLGSGDSSSH